MIRSIQVMDSAILSAVQTAYLWVWDRTGMLVGAVAFAVSAVCGWLVSDGAWWRPIAFMFLMIPFCSLLALLQSKNMALMNRTAGAYRTSFVRSVTVGLLFTSSVSSAMSGEWRMVAYYAIDCLVIGYMTAIQVRDREPPPDRRFAPQGAS